MPNDTAAVQQWTQEQAERLACFMGWVKQEWENREAEDGYLVMHLPDGEFSLYPPGRLSVWNPLRDANADYQVLQRALSAWNLQNQQRLARHLERAYACRGVSVLHPAHRYLRYQVGDYARAVLAVLDSQET